MKIKLNGLEINIETVPSKAENSKAEGNIPILFLHGFTGSSGDWQFLFDKLPHGFTPYAMDIIGHGKSSSPGEASLYAAEEVTSQILGVINHLNFDKVVLAGYSMGGRAALSFAANNPQRMKGLVLESSTAGIINKNERQERRASDYRLADFIENNPIEAFVDYWMDVPLFATLKKLPEDVYLQVRESKIQNSRTGLANSLRGFSTGVMPSLWDKLQEISCRTLLITGELDKKFTAINIEMSMIIKRSHHEVIASAGHNTHLEKPEIFLNLLDGFLRDLQE